MIKSIKFYDADENYILFEDSDGQEQFFIETGVTDQPKRTIQIAATKDEMKAVIAAMEEIIR